MGIPLQISAITQSTTLPLNAIYSGGSSTTVDNSGISITNDSIQDYFGAAAASNGIFIASNSSAWTITGNKFFQTATRTATTGTLNSAIQIITASGGGIRSTLILIGFNSAAGTGTTTYTGSTSRFVGILLTAAASPVSNIQGNTIKNISVTSTSAGSQVTPCLCRYKCTGGECEHRYDYR